MSQTKDGDGGSEDSLIREAVDQLHHEDDRRDAAEMRVEELVRDASFEEESHREGSRANPLLMLAVGVAIAVAALCAWWLHSMCL